MHLTNFSRKCYLSHLCATPSTYTRLYRIHCTVEIPSTVFVSVYYACPLCWRATSNRSSEAHRILAYRYMMYVRYSRFPHVFSWRPKRLQHVGVPFPVRSGLFGKTCKRIFPCIYTYAHTSHMLFFLVRKLHSLLESLKGLRDDDRE
jgi:hypothetical protein